MSEQDTANYRFNAIEERLDKWEEKTDTIINKIDALRTDLLTHRCSQPNMCIVLKSQFDEMSKTLTRLNEKMDQKEAEDEEKLLKIEKDIRTLDLWKNYTLGGIALLTGILSYFSTEIKNLLLH